MGINKYHHHLLILSEDDAYRDIANGFINHFSVACDKISTEKPAGGWQKLIAMFSHEYADDVRKYPNRHVLLLLDLDGEPERYPEEILTRIPPDIKNRVFVLCCRDEAETIKDDLGHGKFEAIGKKLAESCYENTHASADSPWLCPQLQHNQDELIRLATAVRPFLVQS